MNDTCEVAKLVSKEQKKRNLQKNDGGKDLKEAEKSERYGVAQV